MPQAPHPQQSQHKPPEQKKPEADKKAEAERPADVRAHDNERINPKPTNPLPAGIAPHEYDLPIGARPSDKRDPQAAKFEAHAGPPMWNAPRTDQQPQVREEWTPDPALDAREQQPPKGYYADGMSAPDEQRARAAWVEQHGLKEYEEATDQRPAEDRPVFDPNAITGGAFVKGPQQRGRQVPGVTPPTKRD